MRPMVVTLALGTYFADGFAKQGISIAGRFWPYASPQPPQPRLALLQQGATTASLRRMATFT
jgi:hypothetical protein